MKFRYVIERVTDDPFTGEPRYVLSEATPSDPSYRLGGGDGDSEERVKELAQQGASSFDSDVVLVWKDPPAAWGSDDVLAVSQYVDDGVEENL